MESQKNIHQLASEFFNETKKMFKSCKRAYMNLDGDVILCIWGDFTSRKDAINAIRMWGMSFRQLNGRIESKIEGKCYRISITF